MSYPIEQNFIPGLPKIPYDGGVGNYVGVIGHATANNGDSADGERNYESNTWQNAFVHFFVDDTKIEQVADTNYICYGAGHTANHLGYVQVELCQSTDPAKFGKAYAMYTWLLAKLLYNRKLGVVDGVTLMSHAQVSAKWHETDHTDPIEYLASHGKTWANLVEDVTAEYNAMSAPVPQPVAEIYRVKVNGTQIGAYSKLAGAESVANEQYAQAAPGTRVTIECKSDGVVVSDSVKPVPAPQTVPTPAPKPEASKPFVGTAILGKSVATANQCNQFIRGKNPNAPLLDDVYFQMEATYGVRADIAFAQMCKETKYLMFGGSVSAEQHNPAGLGAVGGGVAGAVFADWSQGIEAQVQHLFAYASNEPLPANRPVVDERSKYVKRGSAPWVEWLGIKENPNGVGWASDPGYGLSILGDYLANILKMPDVPVVDSAPAAPVEEPKSVKQQPVVKQSEPNNIPEEPANNGGFFSLILQFLINFFKKLGGRK